MTRQPLILLLLLPIFSYGQTSYTAIDQYVSNLEVKCGGYAELFQILCKATGLECKMVVGYSKPDEKSIGIYKRADHAWNAVKIQGDWKLVDVTWGSGYVEEDTFYSAFNEDYFLTDPDKFIFNHLPTHRQWKLITREVSRTDFHNFPLIHSGFFARALELMPASLNGIIEVEPDETFQIKFESTDKVHSIHMVQDKKENLKPLVFQEKDNVYSADLCFRKKGSHFVTIIVDFKPVWTYRVIVK